MFKTEPGGAAERFARIAAALDSAPQKLADKVEPQALGLAVLGVQAGVYDTVPGEYYVRTGDLLLGIFTRRRLTVNRVSITVGNEAPYARFIELGTYGSAITLEQARARAEALGDTPAVLYLGRSGAAYTLPNPFTTRAAVFAVFALRTEFLNLMNTAARG